MTKSEKTDEVARLIAQAQRKCNSKLNFLVSKDL
jgi:hypothetical protein